MIQTENLPELIRLLPQLLQLQQGQGQQAPPVDPNILLQHQADMNQTGADQSFRMQEMQHEKEMAQMEQQAQGMKAQQAMQQQQAQHEQQMQQMAAQAGLANAAKAGQQ